MDGIADGNGNPQIYRDNNHSNINGDTQKPLHSKGDKNAAKGNQDGNKNISERSKRQGQDNQGCQKGKPHGPFHLIFEKAHFFMGQHRKTGRPRVKTLIFILADNLNGSFSHHHIRPFVIFIPPPIRKGVKP